jgi:hypothetical protein
MLIRNQAESRAAFEKCGEGMGQRTDAFAGVAEHE